MTLSTGSRLGVYEILSPIGAGGMGEVYRARDSRLSRDVAIKVLPAAVASDPDRRMRFEQEARAASALNHPNILTIYDIGEADGTVYIAMELVEGKTLREFLGLGESLSSKKLLDVGVQVAQGLAKAHAAGIVHRDLKPENLMVSKDGFVKILDFGLAKLIEPSSEGASVLPTAVAAPTTPGTVMGTAGYMSPEQASGQSVDYRSDQFTLGAILYEMATGKRAFSRKTGAETLVAIIREEPEPIGQLAPKAPAPMRWLVERLLAKDPEERYASTKDLAREIESVRDHLSETTASGSGAIAAAEPARVRRRGWMLPAALALVVGAGTALFLRSALQPRPDSRVRFQRLTYQRGRIQTARFAPDAQTIVYSAAWEGAPLEIYSVRTDGAESRPLGLKDASVLSVSSKGELAVSLGRHFVNGYETTGTLARVPLSGGAPREILENVQDADWSPDGSSLAVTRYVGTRSRLEYPIGRVLYEAPGWVSDVRVSSDNRRISFVDHPLRGNNDGLAKVIDSAGKVLLAGAFSPGADVTGMQWAPGGGELWSGGIMGTSLKGRTRHVWTGPLGFLQDVASDGRALIFQFNPRREIVGFTAREPRERNLTWLNWAFPTDISPDGETVLFDEQNRQPTGVYTRRLDGSPAVRIDEGTSFAFSPDGRWVLTQPQGQLSRLVVVPTGPGQPRKLPDTGITIQWANWLPDGRRLVVAGSEAGHGSRLFTLDVEGGKPRPITAEGVAFYWNAVSPDGKSVAAAGPDGTIAVYPVAGGPPVPVKGVELGELPIRWSADGRAILIGRRSGAPGVIDRLELATGARTRWKTFDPSDPTGVDVVGPAVVSADEKGCVFSYRRVLGDLYLATGLR